MKIDISVEFVFDVPMSEKAIAALTKLALHHYDGTCKMACREGGFVHRWAALVRAQKESGFDGSILASFSELDICLKIMELPIHLIEHDLTYVDAVRDMKASFRGATALATRNYSTWKATYE